MQAITESMKVHEEWFKEAREMTVDKLPAFITRLTTEYQHDYGTIVHAITAAAVAAAWAVEHSPQGGITGFQSGFVKFGFLTNWDSSLKNVPFAIVNYENMLYPQYAVHFTSITGSTRDWLIAQAKELLEKEDKTRVHPNVWAHWESIAVGNIPFNLSVRKD